MLNITKTEEEGALRFDLEGRLDTVTSGELESEIMAAIPQYQQIVLDMKQLDYISSAGLRVLLAAQKAIKATGVMKVTNISETVAEVFEVTGFSEILNIE